MIVELINWIIMIKYILLGIWGLLLLNSCENDDLDRKSTRLNSSHT